MTTDAERIVARLDTLLAIGRAAREAPDAAALDFVICNRTRELLTYRQALRFRRSGTAVIIEAASGIDEIDRASPYVAALEAMLARLPRAASLPVVVIHAGDAVDALDREALADALPRSIALLHFADGDGAALLFDAPSDARIEALLRELNGVYAHARHALATRRPSRRRLPARVMLSVSPLLLLVLWLPVRLTVLAPAELIARDPLIVTAPLNGVVAELPLEPGAQVHEGDAIVRFDDRELAHQQQVAEQTLALAAERLRQATQQLVARDDAARGRSQFDRAALEREHELAREQASWVASLLARSTINAGRDGVLLYASKEAWLGRPVRIGEKLMEIAPPTAGRVEVWVAADEAIEMSRGGRITFYPDAEPLTRVEATIMQVGYLAEPREGGALAHRVIADIDSPVELRPGYHGVARVDGPKVSLAYWLLRRPLHAGRRFFGI